MKKFILFLQALFVFQSVNAQNKITPAEVKSPKDSAVNVGTVAEDPMNKASWKRSGKDNKAVFSDTSLNNTRTVTYDATGNMVVSDNTSNTQSPNAYPPAIAEYYTQKFPNEKYSVLWTKDKIGNKVYYINRQGKTYWFDQDGKVTSKAK